MYGRPSEEAFQAVPIPWSVTARMALQEARREAKVGRGITETRKCWRGICNLGSLMVGAHVISMYLHMPICLPESVILGIQHCGKHMVRNTILLQWDHVSWMRQCIQQHTPASMAGAHTTA